MESKFQATANPFVAAEFLGICEMKPEDAENNTYRRSVIITGDVPRIVGTWDGGPRS
jgi:hypothetical protein